MKKSKNSIFVALLFMFLLSGSSICYKTFASLHLVGPQVPGDHVFVNHEEMSAVTQSAPPNGHLLAFKVHHLRM